MKKLIVLSVFLFGFALALNPHTYLGAGSIVAQYMNNILGVGVNIALAQEGASQEVTSAPIEAEVTSADLGVADTGILPTSWMYFTKNWGRAIQRTFTFNPVKRAALELDIANQQAAEIAEMKEVAPDRVDAIAKASQNYQDNVDRLKARLEALKETSQNPNVDKLMENLADRSVKHQQLFDELKRKFEDKPELKQRFGEMQDKMNEALIKIPERFDSPEIFKNRMKRVIEARPDSPSRELRGMEMMEKIKEKLPEERRAEFEGIKDDLMKKFEERIGSMPEETQKTFMIPHILERLPPPGDPDFDLKMKVLDDVKGRVLLNPATREQIEASQGQILKEAAEKGEITKEKAEEQIKIAESLVEKLGHTIGEEGVQRAEGEITRMKNALVQAKKHLDNAKTALANGKYGEVFGQASSASMIARNALRGIILFKSQPAPMPIPAPGTRLPPESVKPPTSGTSGTGTTTLSPPPTSIGEQVICTQEYNPVCGINGKTFSNVCHAKVAGVAIKAIGECKSAPESPLSPTLTPIRY